jgi:hypothetical protein
MTCLSLQEHPLKRLILLAWVNDNLLDNRWWESWDHRYANKIKRLSGCSCRLKQWNDIPSSVKQHSEMSFYDGYTLDDAYKVFGVDPMVGIVGSPICQ